MTTLNGRSTVRFNVLGNRASEQRRIRLRSQKTIHHDFDRFSRRVKHDRRTLCIIPRRMRISSLVFGAQRVLRPFLKTTRALSIVTHDGNFHCDEALAVWMLKQTPRFRDSSIVRTRDPSLIQKADVTVDVGDTYDPGCSIQVTPLIQTR